MILDLQTFLKMFLRLGWEAVTCLRQFNTRSRKTTNKQSNFGVTETDLASMSKTSLADLVETLSNAPAVQSVIRQHLLFLLTGWPSLCFTTHVLMAHARKGQNWQEDGMRITNEFIPTTQGISLLGHACLFGGTIGRNREFPSRRKGSGKGIPLRLMPFRWKKSPQLPVSAMRKV